MIARGLNVLSSAALLALAIVILAAHLGSGNNNQTPAYASKPALPCQAEKKACSEVMKPLLDELAKALPATELEKPIREKNTTTAH